MNSTLKEEGRKGEGERRDEFNSQGGRKEGRMVGEEMNSTLKKEGRKEEGERRDKFNSQGERKKERRSEER